VPASILIVDDIESNLIALRAVLSPLGVRVVQASSGEEAISRVREESFAVVLLDVQMPEIDGFEVARRMRARSDIAQPTLVALTGYGQSEDRERALTAGFDEHFVKPIDLMALEHLLNRHPGEV
jgi:CheY-like chemotaxis protein